MFYKDSARADLDFLFNLRNRGDTDFFTGSLMINDGEFACDFFQGLPVIGSGLSRAGNLTVNMAIKAKKVRLINKDADVLLAADLRLKKERRRKTYLTGALDIKSGNYLYRDRRFSLNESRIVFDEKNINDPLLNISGMVKVGRYNINVKIIGSVSSRKVELSSVPYLSESEIKALLLFGKRIDDLSLDEKSELSKDADIAGSLLGNIFLGKAGGELAKFIGIDELLFEPNVSNRGNLEFPSLVLGKNIGNLLYGTYKITSSPVWGASLKQAIGGEVSIFNNLRLRGERYFNESVGIPLEDKLSVEMKVKF
jgi:hypothetical protein